MNPNSTTQMIAQGQHPSMGSFFHILLPQIEEGVSHLLTVIGGKATLHRILSTGEIVSADLNLPVIRAALAAIDSFVEA